MTNFLRVLWVAVVLMALIIPTMLLGMVSATLGEGPGRTQDAAPSGAPAAASVLRPLGAPEAAPRRNNDPILMAGSPSGAWLAVPVTLDRDKKPETYFELWEHQRNAADGDRDIWRLAMNNGQRHTSGTPRALAVLAGTHYQQLRQAERETVTAYVVGPKGDTEAIFAFSINGPAQSYQRLENVTAVAATSTGSGIAGDALRTQPSEARTSRDAVFVLTRSARVIPPATATAPQVGTAPQTSPATGAATTAAATTPATSPASIADQIWDVFAIHLGDAPPEKLASLGKVDSADRAVPTVGSAPVLLYVPGKLILAWREAADDTKLIVRTLPYSRLRGATGPATEPASWSPPVVTDVGEHMGRLFPFTISNRAYIAWAVRDPKVGSQLDLHGRVLDDDLRAQAAGPLFPADLGPMSENVNETRDLAVASSGTAMLVVTCNADGKLQSRVFPVAGGTPGSASPVSEFQPTGPMSPYAQNLVLFMLVALLAISLWQWRLRPVRLSLPKPYRIARIRERFFAAAIDVGIPTVLTLIVFNVLGWSDWADDFEKWNDVLGIFFPLIVASKSIGWPQLLVALSGYILHTAIGEAIGGRSIGKAIVKLKVVALNGDRASFGAIVLRNFVKIPEIATGVLLIYIVISENRQRLCDLLARTVVIDLSGRKFEDAEEADRSAGKKE